jgi:thiamine-monophosphate kinase
MSESSLETLSSIGEQGLLQRLQRFCPEGVIGDDAAVLTVTPGHKLVVTTDVLVDGVHFSVGLANPIVTTPPHSAGFRSAAANLSDLAAMGATPIGITIGLSLPSEMPLAWIESLYEGLVDCLGSVPIVGGDVVRSTVFSLAITAFGEVLSDRVIQRSTARVGDAIVMTGIHGRSRMGLEILLGQELGAGEKLRSSCIQAHQYPRPRLDVMPFLPTTIPAGMDSSDGLADAVLQICRSSGVGARLDGSVIFGHSEVIKITNTIGITKAIDWVLYGGEDFELVLCMSAPSAIEFCTQTGSHCIGIVTEEPDVWLIDLPQGEAHRELQFDRGFQHFPANFPAHKFPEDRIKE